MGNILTSTYLETRTSNYSTNNSNSANNTTSTNTNNSFDSYYTKSVENNNSNETYRKDDYNNKKDNSNYSQNQDSNKEKEVVKKPVTSKENIKEKVVNEDDKKVKDEVESEIAAILASMLGLDLEQVQAFIENNNLTMDNIKEFIMTELELVNTTELLNVENIGEILKEISALVEQLEVVTEEVENFESIITQLIVDDEEQVDKTSNKQVEEKENNNDNKFLANNVEEELVVAVAEEPGTEEVDVETKPKENAEVKTENNSQEAEQFEESNDFLDFNQNEANNVFDVNQKNVEVTGGQFEKVAAARFANVNTQDVINQIVENVKVNFDPSHTEIKIQLSPENLGDITLKVVTENGIITAQFIAENEKVKEIIESNFSHLEDTLKEKGLNISELSVSVGQENQSNEEQLGHYLKEQSKSSRRVTQIINDINEEVEEINEQYYDNDGVVQSRISYTV